jgi:hypothetical protein
MVHITGWLKGLGVTADGTVVPGPALNDRPGAPCGLPEGKRQLRALSAYGTINS